MTLATVLIDPPTTFFAGSILALVSLKLIRVRGADELWRLAQLAAGWSALYALCVGWYFFARTDWMFVYVIDTATLPLVPLYAVFVFVCIAWGVLGALGTGALLLVKKTGLALVSFAGALGGFLLFLYMTLDQYMHVGTYAEYHAGTAKKITDDSAWVTASNVAPVFFGLAAVAIIVTQLKRAKAS